MDIEKNFRKNLCNDTQKKAKYKEKKYPKWFINFLCLFVPSSKNRKNLKKYINKIEYNKFDDDIYKIKQKEKELDEKLDRIIDMQNMLSQKINWSILNNISIHSSTKFPLIQIPDGSQTEFKIQKVDNQLCFRETIIHNKPKIYIITLPKSGTYFTAKILEELGFSHVKIHSFEFNLNDFTSPVFINKELFRHSGFNVEIPFYLQAQLLHDGQFLVGHLPFRCHEYINKNNMLLLIRDLREITISYLRYSQRREHFKNNSWFNLGASEEALLEFFNDGLFRHMVISFAKEFVLWRNEFPDNIIRYEDIINENSNNFINSINKISKCTCTTEDEVLEARKKAINMPTMTYSGAPSTLKNIWTARVEEKFVNMGYDILNEQLGYPREWNTENYPE